ncbi:hypothetical protein D5275_02040 [Adlercreutzia muris]|nr:hypothetical protein [Adlercreutzia muris]
MGHPARQRGATAATGGQARRRLPAAGKPPGPRRSRADKSPPRQRAPPAYRPAAGPLEPPPPWRRGSPPAPGSKPARRCAPGPRAGRARCRRP